MKKKIWKIAAACGLAAFMVAAPAGNGNPLGKTGSIVAEAAKKPKIELEYTKQTLYKGEVSQLKLYEKSRRSGEDPIELNGQAKWKSKNSRVVSVDAQGRIKAKQLGVADILCKYGGKTYKCKVFVRKREMRIVETSDLEDPEYVDSYIWGVDSLELNKGETEGLTVYEAEDWKVKWSSTNEKVASVSPDGLVLAKRQGYTTICAKVKGKILKCWVVVREPKKEKRQKVKITYNKSKTLTVPGATSKTQWYTNEPKTLSLSNKRGKKTTVKVLAVLTSPYVYAKTPGKPTYRFNVRTKRISNPLCGYLDSAKVGETFTWTPIRNVGKPVFKTSDPKRISIDQRGRVKIKAEGVADISCYVDGWGFTIRIWIE